MRADWLFNMIDAGVDAPGVQKRLREATGLDLRIEECLKVKNGAAVYRGTLDGRRVIAKRGLHNAAMVRDTMAASRERMADGPYRVVAPIAATDDILVMEHAPGREVKGVLDALGGGSARRAVLTRCGEWARTYAGTDIETGTFGSGFWLRKHRQPHAEGSLHPEVQATWDALMGWLEDRAARVAGVSVTRGRCHGDLTPMNLHLDDDGVLWGFDIGAEMRLPLARDVARFVVTWLRSSVFEDGFCGQELRALAGPVLPASEFDTLLPFFLGETIAGRLPEERADSEKWMRMRWMVSALMETFP